MNEDSLLVPAVNAVGAVAAFVLWPFLSALLHELAHAGAAKLVGLKPTHLIVGRPDQLSPILKGCAFGVDFEWWPNPFGGMALLDRPITSRVKDFIVTAAGPVSDGVIILVVVYLWPHSSFKGILAIVIIFEVSQVIHNLIPISGVYQGAKVPRDGKRLLQILFSTFSRTPEAGN